MGAGRRGRQGGGLTDMHHVVLCNITSGFMTVTLPETSNREGRECIIKVIGLLSTVTVDSDGGFIGGTSNDT